jgi:hypothetical protein
MTIPVVQGIANMMVHAPSLVQYGSKPFRELATSTVTMTEWMAILLLWDC